MVEQIFLSPQVKRSVIISNKYGIYELPNNLRLKSYSQNENLINTGKKLLKTRVCLKYFVNGCRL